MPSFCEEDDTCAAAAAAISLLSPPASMPPAPALSAGGGEDVPLAEGPCTVDSLLRTVGVREAIPRELALAAAAEVDDAGENADQFKSELTTDHMRSLLDEFRSAVVKVENTCRWPAAVSAMIATSQDLEMVRAAACCCRCCSCSCS